MSLIHEPSLRSETASFRCGGGKCSSPNKLHRRGFALTEPATKKNESVPRNNPGTLIAEPLSKCGPTLARAMTTLYARTVPNTSPSYLFCGISVSAFCEMCCVLMGAVGLCETRGYEGSPVVPIATILCHASRKKSSAASSIQSTTIPFGIPNSPLTLWHGVCITCSQIFPGCTVSVTGGTFAFAGWISSLPKTRLAPPDPSGGAILFFRTPFAGRSSARTGLFRPIDSPVQTDILCVESSIHRFPARTHPVFSKIRVDSTSEPSRWIGRVLFTLRQFAET